jgi:16S rRNA (adenine1518-N6/adenine1519-N6)-dimethyltransferase
MSPQRLGQNFLTDPGVAARIVECAREYGKLDTVSSVLEIGPGKGALTGQLFEIVDRLTLIEFDSNLADQWRRHYEGDYSVDVVEADARLVDPASLPLIEGRDYVLVANLPYYAATPIIRNFLESSHPPSCMVVMVQREVAQDITAEPGQMSMLSLAVQVNAMAQLFFDAPPKAFTPAPKVHSSVIGIWPLAVPQVAPEDQDEFFRLAKAGFKAPRKQLHNSLAGGLNIDLQLARSLVESAGIDSERRPSTLSIDEWKTMLACWREAGKPFVVHGTSREERKKALER